MDSVLEISEVAKRMLSLGKFSGNVIESSFKSGSSCKGDGINRINLKVETPNMTSPQPSKGRANLQLAIWNKQAEASTSEQLYIRIQKLGLPEEIVARLHDLILKVQQVAGKVIHIGKIILIKLLEFVEEHFFLVAGAGIGAVLGAALAGLITSIPIVGQLLAPIATALGLTVTALGAIAGNELDKAIPNFGKSLVDTAKEFFNLFASILSAIFDDQQSITSIA